MELLWRSFQMNPPCDGRKIIFPNQSRNFNLWIFFVSQAAELRGSFPVPKESGMWGSFPAAFIPAHSRSGAAVAGAFSIRQCPIAARAARPGSCVELLPVETMLQERGWGAAAELSSAGFSMLPVISRGKLTNCWRHLFPVPLTFCSRLPPSMRDSAQEFAVTHRMLWELFFTRGWTRLPYKRCLRQPGLLKIPGFLRESLGPSPKMHFRNFHYSFSSLIACLADGDVFTQPETRVGLMGLFLGTSLRRCCFFLPWKAIPGCCERLGAWKCAAACSDGNGSSSGSYSVLAVCGWENYCNFPSRLLWLFGVFWIFSKYLILILVARSTSL